MHNLHKQKQTGTAHNRPPLYTADGICTDITKSSYTVSIGNYKYFFSSKLNKDKFTARYKEEYNKLMKFFKEQFYMVISDMYNYSNIRLYNKIEKRGFCIQSLSNEEIYNCSGGVLLLNGLAINIKNYKKRNKDTLEN